ncbi:hypothetical protein [Bradyrhizobium arachidis]|uniref:Uncharacterized protein n=1 Tax=Bradyrhizobium arachidis TaxID=858423 RepID=A0AAE7NY93_9BRAD|nr:hypothetical protein [Bradyrhizobium arachidis]QOZ71119.1 hypothetical protein WN72_36045 [Bradyrhizobium arachidis]SFV19931.1 hypothetical protein SAMN05192541_1783 [Bradyrhizobium arachidis]
MASPSIIPNDRLDRDFYLVLEEFRDGAAFRETDEGVTYATLIGDMLTGQYDRVAGEGHEISEALRDFVESQLGRAIGIQLALPLRMASYAS